MKSGVRESTMRRLSWKQPKGDSSIADGAAWGPAQPPGFVRDACSQTVTGNAELQTSAFLKDGTSHWHILKLPWFGKGKWDYVFWGISKGVGT